MYVCIYIYIYICMYICIYIYICIIVDEEHILASTKKPYYSSCNVKNTWPTRI